MTKLRDIKLLKITETLDELRQPTTALTAREVVAEVRNASQSEYFQGRQAGITPDYTFKMSIFDYDGERALEYEGKQYAIYRTSEFDDDITLYCQIEGGITNGVVPTPPTPPTPTPDPTPTPEPNGEG